MKFEQLQLLPFSYPVWGIALPCGPQRWPEGTQLNAASLTCFSPPEQTPCVFLYLQIQHCSLRWIGLLNTPFPGVEEIAMLVLYQTNYGYG